MVVRPKKCRENYLFSVKCVSVATCCNVPISGLFLLTVGFIGLGLSIWRYSAWCFLCAGMRAPNLGSSIAGTATEVFWEPNGARLWPSTPAMTPSMWPHWRWCCSGPFGTLSFPKHLGTKSLVRALLQGVSLKVLSVVSTCS